MNEQLIFRSEAQNNYTVMSNTTINKKDLSYRARGILYYLLSKPRDWRTRMCDIEANGTEGREAIRTAIAELEEKGHLVKTEVRTKGRIGYEYRVFEQPPTQKRPSDDGNPSAEPRLLQSNELQSNENKLSSPSSKESPKPEKASDSKEPSKSTPTVKANAYSVIAKWCELWKAQYGETYVFPKNEHGKVKSLITKAGGDIEGIASILKAYLADGHDFFKNDRHPLCKLPLNKYAVRREAEETGCRKLVDDNRPAVRMND